MTWLARLDLDYTQESGRSAARYLHNGPLRILQSLYPESDAVCHNVLVHPPGGLVGGDTLDMRVTVGSGAPRPMRCGLTGCYWCANRPPVCP